jgi:glycosyltransferase 2 family protein
MPGWVMPAIAYSLSIGCLIWVFHGVDLGRIVDDFGRMDLRWVVAAIVAEIAVYVIQGWRWSILLRPIQRVPIGTSVRAVYVGIFANEVLPLRSGELIRCFLQARWNKLPFAKVLSSVFIERIFDGVIVAAAFFLLARMAPVPRFMQEAAKVLAISMAVAVVGMIYLRLRQHPGEFLARGPRWLGWLRHLMQGIHDMGDLRTVLLVLGFSLPYFALQVVPFYGMVRSFDLGLSMAASFLLLVIIRIGTIVPQAPGNVGTFQFLVVVGLGMFGVDKATAASLSVLMFSLVTLPLLVGGAVALALTGLKLGDLHRSARKFDPALEPAAD